MLNVVVTGTTLRMPGCSTANSTTTGRMTTTIMGSGLPTISPLTLCR